MFFPAAWLLGILATSSFAGYVDAQQRSKEPVENALKLFSAGNPHAFWSKMPDSIQSADRPLRSTPGPVGYFGITWTNRSREVVSDRDFLLTAVEVVEDIYNNHGNASEVVTHYQGPAVLMNPNALDISAVGRGREPGLSITFNNAAMVLFTRWLVQVFGSHRWYEFYCEFGTVVEGKPVSFVVARGKYTALKLGIAKFPGLLLPGAQKE